MQFPRIHLNGTSAQSLLAEHIAALAAVEDAIAAVQAITCHGRDYYVISSEAASTAFAEKTERLNKLISVRDDLDKLATYLAERS